MHQRIIAIISAALAASTPAHASDMDPVVVTATRTAQTADQSLASVTVLDRQAIEASQAETLEELLTARAGIDIARSGGPGSQTSLFMRGTNSDHVLVLIDGLRQGSATSGTTALNFLPLDQIERIEIVRGPRSSLYGSEAIGGVIQIFTRQGSDDGRTQFQTGVGSYNLRRDNLATSGSHGNSRYSFNFSNLETDGFDARQPTSGFFGVDEPDDDGYTNRAASLRLEHLFDNGLELDARIMRSQGDNEFDGNPNSADFVQQASGLTIAYPFNGLWYSSLTLGETRDEYDSFNNGVASSSFHTRRRHANWQNDLLLGDTSTLTLGVDFQRDEVQSDTAFSVTERDNTGVYIQYQGRTGKHDYLVSLRNDDYDAFDGETTGNIAWGYAINEPLRVTASYGSAYKVPTFNDLYWPASAFFAGNPNLKPETSTTGEIGLAGRYSWGGWNANYFQTEIDDVIVYDGSVLPGTMNNLDAAEIDGIEIGLQTSLADWHIGLDLTKLDTQDRQTGNTLPRRAEESLRLDIDRSVGRAEVGASLIAQGSRYDDAANTIEVAGYGIVNLRGELALDKHWRLKGSIDNVADKTYEIVDTYNTGGRTVFIGVSYDTL